MALECCSSKDVSVIAAQGKLCTKVHLGMHSCPQVHTERTGGGPELLQAIQIAVLVSTIVILKEFPFLHHSSSA